MRADVRSSQHRRRRLHSHLDTLAQTIGQLDEFLDVVAHVFRVAFVRAHLLLALELLFAHLLVQLARLTLERLTEASNTGIIKKVT